MAQFIPADGSRPQYDVIPENGTDFQLEELYKLLSCNLIELRQLSDGRLMVFDEEGKLKGLPRNERATARADFPTPRQLMAAISAMCQSGINVIWSGEMTDSEVDFIAGEVLICTADAVR